MKRIIRALLFTLTAVCSLLLLMLWLAYAGVFGKLPEVQDLQAPETALASELLAEGGAVMGKYYLHDRVALPYGQMGTYVEQALVATEDERFYRHGGIDWRALARSVFTAGRRGGGSTLSMQTAKNLFTEDWMQRSALVRSVQKLKEALIARQLELQLSKQQILTLYLNTVSFSDNVPGVGNAAQTFFSKPPALLNPAEAATLVAMLKAPSVYNPRSQPQKSLARRNLVLDQMVRNAYLSPAEARHWKAQPLGLRYQRRGMYEGPAPYLRLYLGGRLKEWCRQKGYVTGEEPNLYTAGLKIQTSIDTLLQRLAEEAVQEHLQQAQRRLEEQPDIRSGRVWKGREGLLEREMRRSDRWAAGRAQGMDEKTIRAGFAVPTPMRVFAWNENREKDTVMTPADSIRYHRQLLQCALLLVNAHTGDVKAWVGGIDARRFKLDHVAATRRQVGSTIKPLLYALAMQTHGLTKETVIPDQQQHFGAFGPVPASRHNCSGGRTRIIDALAYSRNCASAYLLRRLDHRDTAAALVFKTFLEHCGLPRETAVVPSLAVGTAEASLLEMVSAYSMFANRGFLVKPVLYQTVKDKHGQVLDQEQPVEKPVITPGVAAAVEQMMQAVMQYGTGKHIAAYGLRGRPAGKTGTTNDNSDAWFIGYNGPWLAGVWVGCDDRFIRLETKQGEASSMALPVWARLMKKLQDAGY